MAAEEAAEATKEAPAGEAKDPEPAPSAEAGAGEADKVAEALEKVGVSGERRQNVPTFPTLCGDPDTPFCFPRIRVHAGILRSRGSWEWTPRVVP